MIKDEVCQIQSLHRRRCNSFCFPIIPILSSPPSSMPSSSFATKRRSLSQGRFDSAKKQRQSSNHKRSSSSNSITCPQSYDGASVATVEKCARRRRLSRSSSARSLLSVDTSKENEQQGEMKSPEAQGPTPYYKVRNRRIIESCLFFGVRFCRVTELHALFTFPLFGITHKSSFFSSLMPLVRLLKSEEASVLARHARQASSHVAPATVLPCCRILPRKVVVVGQEEVVDWF